MADRTGYGHAVYGLVECRGCGWVHFATAPGLGVDTCRCGVPGTRTWMRPTDGAHLPVGATLNGIVVREDVMERLPAEDLDRLERLVMDIAPGPRRAMLVLAGLTDPEERAFAAKALGRAGLKTYERVLDARHYRATAEGERLTTSLDETTGYYDIVRDADGDITLGGERPAMDKEDEP